jgi:hypothetical protein
MPFKENLENYLSHNFITYLNNNSSEIFFKDPSKFGAAIDKEIKDINNSKFNVSNYKQIINTATLADMFMSRNGSESAEGFTNFYPEVGMIFLKSYIKQLLDNDKTLKPEKLINIFNKNQELIEIQHSILLYLGGLYYFQLGLAESGKYIKKQDDKIFSRINDVNYNTNNEYQFNLKIFNEDKIITIPDNIKSNVYGIENKFLNAYNKELYGIYLNGDITLNNEQKPHILSAGYLGIIKPIKTYDTISDLGSFNALYGNLLVDTYNYQIEELITDLSTATFLMDLDNTSKQLINNKQLIKSFIVYSKLKANFLSSLYPNKEDLKKPIKNIIDGVTNIRKENLSDFYYLISRIFFKDNVNVIKNDNKPLNPKLKKFNHIPTLNDNAQIDSLVDMLYYIWSLEKNNLQNKKYNILNTKSVFTLYPSCGGFISPYGFIDTLKDTDKEKQNMIKRNSTRFLWFESTRLGNDFLADSSRIKSDDSRDGVELSVNNQSFFRKNNITINSIASEVDEFKKNISEEYKFNYILDSLDFEKLENLRQMFIDFVTFNKSQYIVDGYNLKSLIIASSTITYDDITDLKDDKTNFTLTKDEINLALIGNSIHQYDFMTKCGLGKYLNAALTIAQKTKTEDVCSDFCNSLTTIGNFSTIGSINLPNTPELSIHKFQTSPEILFSNATDYDSLITFLGGDVDKTNKYLTRRILFNDQYIDSFTELTQGEINSITNLNDVYLYNKLYTLSNSSKIKNEKELYVSIVTEFFRYLNIKYSDVMYKHLFKLIRTFTYRCLSDLKYLDLNYVSQNSNQSNLSNTSSSRFSTEAIPLEF